MQRKAESEFRYLTKIGVPENMALLIVKHKYKIDEEEVEWIINDIKEEQLELKNEIQNFIEMSKKIEDKNLISNDNINTNDKNEDKTV